MKSLYHRVSLAVFGFVVTPLAMAVPPDTTAIEATISDNLTAAITVGLAFAAAVLGIRALKLIKRGA